ncbi:MAG: Ig-like domain-containing protein, partial [Sulfuricurvum sp.]
TWSYVLTSAAITAMGQDGETLTIVSTDTAGNSTTATKSISVDTVAPTTPTIATSTNTYNTSFDAGFSVDAGAIVTVTGTTIDKFTKTTIGDIDTYTAKANAFVGTEIIKIDASITDVAGNTSLPATQIILKSIDTTVATPLVTVTDSGVVDTITNDASLLNNSVPSGITRTYSTDNATASLSYTAPTTEGSHTVIISDTDSAGNTASETLTFTLDTIAPSAPMITSIANTYNAAFDAGFSINTGSSVIVTVNGTALGDWSEKFVKEENVGAPDKYTAIMGVFDGTEIILVDATLTDGAGNTSPSATQAALKHIDTSAPISAEPTVVLTNDSAISGDMLTNDASLSVTPIATSELIHNYSIDGGASSTNYTPPITNGEHTVVVTDTDTAGNVASFASITFMLDKTAPSNPIISLENNTGSALDNISSNTDSIIVSPLAEGDMRTYQMGSDAPADSYTAPTIDGVYSLIVTDTDGAGNVASSTFIFIRDTVITTPTVRLTTNSGSTSDSLTNSANLTFSTASETVVRTYSINGATAISSYTAPTSNGDYTVVVTDTDVAGNTAFASIDFTLDNVAPSTPSLSLMYDTGASLTDYITNTVGAESIIVSDLTENGITRTYQLDTGSTLLYIPTISEGAHTLKVTDTDTAGNAISSSLSFTRDTTIDTPTVSLTTDSGIQGDNLTKNAALTFSPKAADVTRIYSINDATATSSYIAPTIDGQYTVVVTDTDTAGNSVFSSISFSLDKTAPDTPPTIDEIIAGDNVISQSEALTGVLIGGSAEAGSTVSIFDPKLTVTALTALTDESGAWSYTLSSADIATLGTGTHNVILSATDAAGNVSTTTTKSFEIGYSIANGATWQSYSDTNGFIADIYSITGNTAFDGNYMLGTSDSIKILNGSLDTGESITINNAMSAISYGGTIEVADSAGNVTINIDNGVTSASFTNSVANPNVSVNILGDYAISDLSITGSMTVSFGEVTNQETITLSTLVNNGAQTFNYTGVGYMDNLFSISGFESGTDKIDLSSLGIIGTNKVLNAENFVSGAGAVALDANDFIINDTTTGNVYYDADGNTPDGFAAVLLLTLTDHAVLSNTDFKVL